MKNILITGTSTGVGYESAVLFAQEGYKVYATMRNLKKADTLKAAIAEQNLNIEILPLDVTKIDTIHSAVDTIIANDGKIDILLNNAGAGFARPVEQADIDQVDWVTDVNYKGVVLTTKVVLPHMRLAQSGHIINVTSVGGLVGQPFNELYCGAKFAVEGFTEALAAYVTPSFGIQFTNIEPGGISTEFMNNAVAQTSHESGELVTGDYAPIFQKYIAGASERSGGEEESPYQTGKEVAEIIVKAAKMENPPLRMRTSEWAERLCQLKTEADPDGTKLVKQVQSQFL